MTPDMSAKSSQACRIPEAELADQLAAARATRIQARSDELRHCGAQHRAALRFRTRPASAAFADEARPERIRQESAPRSANSSSIDRPHSGSKWPNAVFANRRTVTASSAAMNGKSGFRTSLARHPMPLTVVIVPNDIKPRLRRILR